MHFNLKKPCKTCPFRTDREGNYGWLGKERAKEIIDSILGRQDPFPCHKTTRDDENGEYNRCNAKEEQCAGAVILMEKLNRPNIWMRISRIKGWYKPETMLMDSPVVDTGEQFIKMHDEDAEKPI